MLGELSTSLVFSSIALAALVVAVLQLRQLSKRLQTQFAEHADHVEVEVQQLQTAFKAHLADVAQLHDAERIRSEQLRQETMRVLQDTAEIVTHAGGTLERLVATHAHARELLEQSSVRAEACLQQAAARLLERAEESGQALVNCHAEQRQELRELLATGDARAAEQQRQLQELLAAGAARATEEQREALRAIGELLAAGDARATEHHVRQQQTAQQLGDARVAEQRELRELVAAGLRETTTRVAQAVDQLLAAGEAKSTQQQQQALQTIKDLLVTQAADQQAQLHELLQADAARAAVQRKQLATSADQQLRMLLAADGSRAADLQRLLAIVPASQQETTAQLQKLRQLLAAGDARAIKQQQQQQQLQAIQDLLATERVKMGSDLCECIARLEQAAELRLCHVCMEGKRTQLAVPCGHVTACVSCEKSLQTCPVCRGGVQRWVKVYF